MATVSLDASGAFVVLGIEGWPQTSDEKREWLALTKWAARYAFEARPASLITVSPVAGSLGHSLPKPALVTTDRGRLLVNRVARCSAELIDDIAASEEFQRGLLWVAGSEPAMTPEAMDGVFREVVSEKLPDASDRGLEVLLLVDDGRQLRWMHPGRAPGGMLDGVSSLAKSLGWRLTDGRQHVQRT